MLSAFFHELLSTAGQTNPDLLLQKGITVVNPSLHGPPTTRPLSQVCLLGPTQDAATDDVASYPDAVVLLEHLRGPEQQDH